MEEKKKGKRISGFWIARIIAILLFAGGLCMIIVNSVRDEESPALIICGCFSIVIGFIVLMFTLLPLMQKGMIKLNKKIIEENKEDLQDLSTTQSEIMSEGVKNISKAAVEGVQEAKDTKYCMYCGKEINANSRFCQYCGKEQK